MDNTKSSPEYLGKATKTLVNGMTLQCSIRKAVRPVGDRLLILVSGSSHPGTTEANRVQMGYNLIEFHLSGAGNRVVTKLVTNLAIQDHHPKVKMLLYSQFSSPMLCCQISPHTSSLQMPGFFQVSNPQLRTHNWKQIRFLNLQKELG